MDLNFFEIRMPEHLSSAKVARFAGRCLRVVRPVRRLDTCGASAVEFAIVAAPFFALMIAIFEISISFFVQQTLETAGERASRQLMTGKAQTSNMTQAQYKALVCANLPDFMHCDRLIVDVRSGNLYSQMNMSPLAITFNGSGKPSADTRFAPGKGGEITVSKIMYVWDGNSGPLGFSLSNMANGSRLITAVNVFKTEIYT